MRKSSKYLKVCRLSIYFFYQTSFERSVFIFFVWNNVIIGLYKVYLLFFLLSLGKNFFILFHFKFESYK